MNAGISHPSLCSFSKNKTKILFWLSAPSVFILPSLFLVHWPQSIRICQLFKSEVSVCPCPEKCASNKRKAVFHLNETFVSFLWEMLFFLMGFCLSKCYNLPVGCESLSINLKYKVMLAIHTSSGIHGPQGENVLILSELGQILEKDVSYYT